MQNPTPREGLPDEDISDHAGSQPEISTPIDLQLLMSNDDSADQHALLDGGKITRREITGRLEHPEPDIVLIWPEEDAPGREPIVLHTAKPDAPPVDHEHLAQSTSEDPFGDETPKPKKAKPLVPAVAPDPKTPTKEQTKLEQLQDVRRKVRKRHTIDERAEKEAGPGQVSSNVAPTAQAPAPWTPLDTWPVGGWKIRARCSIPPSQSSSKATEPVVDIVLVYLYKPIANDKSLDLDPDLTLFRDASKQENTNSESKSKKGRRAKVLNWLTDDSMLQKSLPGARITTVGFDITPTGFLSASPIIETAAAQLSDYLAKSRAHYQPPIVFIGHSLGAMFILQSLGVTPLQTASDVSVLQHTAGILTFAYPVPTSDRRSQMLATLYGIKATDKLLSDLSGQPSIVRFIKLMRTALAVQSSRERPSQTSSEEKKPPRIEVGFPIHQVYARDEHRDSKDSLSSFIGVPVRLESSGKDHSNVLRFTNPKDEDFVRLISMIKSCLQTYKLLHAAASGTVNEVETLINQGVDVNTRDRWNQTALQIAVRRNNERMVNALLRVDGIQPNIPDLKLHTPLHYAVRVGNEYMINNLIHHGADANVENYKKRTPRDLAENHKSRKHIAKLLSSRLVSGPDQSLRSQRVGTGSAPDTEDGKLACKNFQVTITEIYASETSDQHWSVNVSVWTLLYGSKSLEDILHQVRPHAVEPQVPVCIWIHVPENNMIWIEDLFAKIDLDPAIWEETRRSVNPNRTITPHLGNKNIRTENIRSVFLPYLSYEANFRQDKRNECIHSADETHRRHRLASRTFSRTTTVAVSRTATEATLTAETVGGQLLKVPDAKDPDHYPDVSSLDDSDSDISEVFELGNTDDLEEEEKALMRYYLNNPPALHVRRTLDQYYYHMLESTQERDKDQVVSRWYQRVKGQSRLNILMVDQLWLWTSWKRSPKTTFKDIATAAKKQQQLGNNAEGQKLPKDRYVISCFPSRTGTKNTLHRTLDDLRQFVLDPHDRKRDPIQRPEDLISRILQTCFGTFDPLQDAESLRFFQMFEDSVGAIDDKETRLFRAFQRGSTRLLELNSVNKYYETRKSELLINLLDIRDEIKLLVEVKDIRDDINIILSVLHIQKSLVEQMSEDKSTMQGLLRNATVENMVKADVDDFTKLDGQAKSIQEKLNTLMDLKQKAANAWEAREARETAVAASKQGNTVMVFTVVTIIFLPLSFLSSFFTIGIAAFPKDTQSGETNWPLGFILALLFGISLCVSLPLVLFALNMDRAKQKITELRRNQLSLITIRLINLLSPAGTGDKTNSYRSYWRQRLQNYRDEYIKWRDEYIRGEAENDNEEDVGGLAELIRKLGPTDPFPLDASQRGLFGTDENDDVPFRSDTKRKVRDFHLREKGADDEMLVGG